MCIRLLLLFRSGARWVLWTLQYLTMASFEEILAQQGKLAYTNVGISMMPLLRQHRDVLIIAPRPVGRLKLWDVPLFRRASGQYVMHRVLWVGRHSYVMCGDNQWRPEFGVTDDQILGVLEAVKRRPPEGVADPDDGRLLPVRSTPEHPHVPFKYRVYVFLWCFFFPIRAFILWFNSKLRRVRSRLRSWRT